MNDFLLAIKISRVDRPTIVVVVAEHEIKNTLLEISCEHDNPLGGYVYDVQMKCYYTEGCDYLALGSIPYGYIVTVAGCDWQQRIPAPESVLMQYFSDKQKEDLDCFKNKHPDCKFNFMQILACM